jgi:methylmalonyl-CoA/ethylmalonyl-CoA epimerase
MRIDHIGVIVDDLEEAGRLLADALGLPRQEGTTNDAIRTAFFQCGDASIEAIEVLDPERRSERLGHDATARIEHIAIEVDDLEAVLQALSALGIQAKAPPRFSRDYLTFWTDPATSDGIMLQFLSRSSRR